MRPSTMLFMLATLLPGLLSGQTQATDTTTERYQLQTIQISGIRAGADDPVAQTNVDAVEIDRLYAGQDGAFLLSQVAPSIISYSEAGTGFSNYGQMRLRGIDQTRINITLDGVPLNDMLDQGVFFSNFTDFGNSLRSVQVQRGVGTSTNGTASYAGSVNFESVSVFEPQASTEIQLNAGSFGTYRGSAEFRSGLLNDHFAFYGRVTNFTTDGYRYHSGTDSWSMFLSGGYLDEKQSLTFTAFNGRTRSGLAYFPVPEPLIEQDPRTNLNYEQDEDNFGQYLVQAKYTRRLQPGLDLSTSLYYGGAGGDFPFGYDENFGNSGPLAGQINYPLQNWHYGGMANLSYEQGGLNLKGGVHAYRFDRRNWETNLPDNTVTVYDDSSRKEEVSAFVKGSYTTGPLTFFGDLQARAPRMQFFPDYRFIAEAAAIPDYDYLFFNPKVGLNLRLLGTNRQSRRWLSAYASFGRTGREPTKFDIFAGSTRLDSSNLAAVQDVETIRPEFVNDFEAGLRWALNSKENQLSGQFNLFWMDFQDEIAPIGERVVFVQLRKNLPQSVRRGLELEAEWQHRSGWFAQGFLTLMDARVQEYAPDFEDTVYTDTRPALTPAFMGQLSTGYRLGEQLEVAVTGRYIGEQFITPRNEPELTVPASFVLDGRVRWTFWKKHELALYANNLLDALYYTYGEVGSYENRTVPAFYVQPPRNVNVMLTLRF